MKILIINGPNINLLGIREPEIYGNKTYGDLTKFITEECGEAHEIDFVQSNHEGDIIDAIQEARLAGVEGIVINPAAYTHTSIAIADAIRAVGIPTVEVHISDVFDREDYRNTSYVREACVAAVVGKGIKGYIDAVDILNTSVGTPQVTSRRKNNVKQS